MKDQSAYSGEQMQGIKYLFKGKKKKKISKGFVSITSRLLFSKADMSGPASLDPLWKLLLVELPSEP